MSSVKIDIIEKKNELVDMDDQIGLIDKNEDQGQVQASPL